jgi:hypothetical protein
VVQHLNAVHAAIHTARRHNPLPPAAPLITAYNAAVSAFLIAARAELHG